MQRGTGKTYTACAFGQSACRHGLSTRYYRFSRLRGDLALARANGSYPKLLERLSKTDLLLLDDYGLAPLSDNKRREILEDRYGRRATLITSQLPLEHWHDAIGDNTFADAILDRLVHGAQLRSSGLAVSRPGLRTFIFRKTAMLRLLLIPLSIVLLGCSSSSAEAVHGTWIIWSIDGIPPLDAKPRIIDVQADTGRSWEERVLENLEVEILPGGDYTSLWTELPTFVMTHEYFEEVTGRQWRTNDRPHESRPRETTVWMGEWKLEGGSLSFFRSQGQVHSRIMKTVETNMTGMIDLERFAVRLDSILSHAPRIPELSGSLEDSRLVLLDNDGRRMVFRRKGE